MTTADIDDDDVDSDGNVNWLDTDRDGDGIDDADEPGDENANGVPDYLEANVDVPDSGGLNLQGGRGVGCTIGETDHGGPIGALFLMLALCLGIRRYGRS